MIVEVENRDGTKYLDELRGKGKKFLQLRDHGTVPFGTIKRYRVPNQAIALATYEGMTNPEASEIEG